MSQIVWTSRRVPYCVPSAEAQLGHLTTITLEASADVKK